MIASASPVIFTCFPRLGNTGINGTNQSKKQQWYYSNYQMSGERMFSRFKITRRKIVTTINNIV